MCQNGRGLSDVALAKTSRSGRLVVSTSAPGGGSAGCGVVIVTPGRGPARLGLSGFSLFWISQAALAISAAISTKFVIDFTDLPIQAPSRTESSFGPRAA